MKKEGRKTKEKRASPRKEAIKTTGVIQANVVSKTTPTNDTMRVCISVSVGCAEGTKALFESCIRSDTRANHPFWEEY
jgi:hypothetical protein